jgi:hypothetical protein
MELRTDAIAAAYDRARAEMDRLNEQFGSVTLLMEAVRQADLSAAALEANSGTARRLFQELAQAARAVGERPEALASLAQLAQGAGSSLELQAQRREAERLARLRGG